MSQGNKYAAAGLFEMLKLSIKEGMFHMEKLKRKNKNHKMVQTGMSKDQKRPNIYENLKIMLMI